MVYIDREVPLPTGCRYCGAISEFDHTEGCRYIAQMRDLDLSEAPENSEVNGRNPCRGCLSISPWGHTPNCPEVNGDENGGEAPTQEEPSEPGTAIEQRTTLRIGSPNNMPIHWFTDPNGSESVPGSLESIEIHVDGAVPCFQCHSSVTMLEEGHQTDCPSNWYTHPDERRCLSCLASGGGRHTGGCADRYPPFYVSNQPLSVVDPDYQCPGCLRENGYHNSECTYVRNNKVNENPTIPVTENTEQPSDSTAEEFETVSVSETQETDDTPDRYVCLDQAFAYDGRLLVCTRPYGHVQTAVAKGDTADVFHIDHVAEHSWTSPEKVQSIGAPETLMEWLILIKTQNRYAMLMVAALSMIVALLLKLGVEAIF